MSAPEGGGHVGNEEEEMGLQFDSSSHRVGFVEEGGGDINDDDTYSGLLSLSTKEKIKF